MSYGLGYDSDEARALAGSITAIMTGEAYVQSARTASEKGSFPGYRDSRATGIHEDGCRRQYGLDAGGYPIAPPAL